MSYVTSILSIGPFKKITQKDLQIQKKIPIGYLILNDFPAPRAPPPLFFFFSFNGIRKLVSHSRVLE